MFAIFLVFHAVIWNFASCLGPLPDASQEGLLWPWKGYASVALFHFNVPEESTRATFEFASFQDDSSCPQRQVHVWLQHGSYPVINASSTDEFPTDKFYMERSYMEWLTLKSAFKPSETLVHPIYAPEPGSWFAAAYLEPTNEPQGFLRQHCRYSLGSIALWNRAENVALIQSNQLETFQTNRHFSYYKFYVPEEINQFTVTLSNCKVLLKTSRPLANNQSCIEYIGLRAKALPLHRPMEFQQEWRNLSTNATAVFTENRPYEAVHYYILVVSNGRVSFDVHIHMNHCGDSGIYGPVQSQWYLNERGLVWESSDKPVSKKSVPKEPTTGFQLFSNRISADTRNDLQIDPDNGAVTDISDSTNLANNSQCVSKFDFTRIDNVREFSVIYMVQGRSWYTKWLTVLESVPIFTRFRTFEYTDNGGSLNIRIRIDTDLNSHSSELLGFYHIVKGCISRGREPRVISNTGELACDNHSSTLKVANLHHEVGVESLKVVPFPEPGNWYIGFQLSCRNFSTGDIISCPKSSVSTMVSVDVNIQPCDYRPLRESCGGNGHGLCTTNHKSSWSFSSCQCTSGFKGWTCDQIDKDAPHSTTNTLLLTLSNLLFLPAIVLAFYRQLYGPCLVYTATMIFSIFYHACDQESFSGSLPSGLQITCLSLYVNNEVLQFCDFFSAILSFWVTVVCLSSLPAGLTNACNLFGALLVAFLVQYNRTGNLVLLIPVPLGLLIIILSQIVRIFKRKRCQIPSRRSILVYIPAILCLGMATILATLVGTDRNYPYVHSGWHLLISLSLAFLIAKCGQNRSKVSVLRNHVRIDSLNEDSEAATNVTIATAVGDTITEMPSGPDSQNNLAVPEMENVGNTNNAETNRGNVIKRLSYLQKFSALIARHES